MLPTAPDASRRLYEGFTGGLSGVSSGVMETKIWDRIGRPAKPGVLSAAPTSRRLRPFPKADLGERELAWIDRPGDLGSRQSEGVPPVTDDVHEGHEERKCPPPRPAVMGRRSSTAVQMSNAIGPA